MEPMTMMALATLASGALGAAGNLFGSKNKLSKLPTKTKEQQAFQGNILQQAMGMQGQGGGYGNALNYWQDLLNPQSASYNDFAAPYMNEFEQQTVPRLADRFAGYGNTSGALSSSGFAQALGGAGAGLQAKLAALKAGLQQQAAGALTNQFNNLAGIGLSDQFAYGSQPGGGGVVGGFGAGASQSLPLLLYMMSQSQGGQNSGSPALTSQQFDPYGYLNKGYIQPGGAS
jgi:hypothetical protein